MQVRDGTERAVGATATIITFTFVVLNFHIEMTNKSGLTEPVFVIY